MNPAVLAYANLAIQVIPMLIQAGQGVMELLANLKTVLNSSSGPTQVDWDQLDSAMTAAMKAMLAAAQGPGTPEV